MVRGNAKPSPDMAFGLFYYVPLHNIRDGIRLVTQGPFAS
jgi:hypothetical protein